MVLAEDCLVRAAVQTESDYVDAVSATNGLLQSRRARTAASAIGAD